MVAKKKSWYKIVAPRSFKNVELGETPAYDPKSLVGRTIIVSARDLVSDAKKEFLKVKLKIDKVANGNAETKIVQLEIPRPYLTRIIRRRTSKVESIDDVTTSDGKKIRIKTVAITRYRTQTTKKKIIRKALSEEVKKVVSTNKFDRLVMGIISGKIQNSLMLLLKKIYPLRYLEVRKLEVKK